MGRAGGREGVLMETLSRSEAEQAPFWKVGDLHGFRVGDQVCVTKAADSVLTIPGDLGIVEDVQIHPRTDAVMLFVDFKTVKGWINPAFVELEVPVLPR